MSKGLEALKYLKENKRKHWLGNDNSAKCLDTIEKELKALEIIKIILKDFISFNIIELPHINKVHYEIKIFDETIYVSKEKYDLLKEVLL